MLGIFQLKLQSIFHETFCVTLRTATFQHCVAQILSLVTVNYNSHPITNQEPFLHRACRTFTGIHSNFQKQSNTLIVIHRTELSQLPVHVFLLLHYDIQVFLRHTYVRCTARQLQSFAKEAGNQAINQ